MQVNENIPNKKLNLVVPIKTTGNKQPLFLIHSSRLNVVNFKPLKEYFDENRPFYGIQAIGLESDAIVPDTIEQIASEYIKEILTVDPDGPYYLAGYSQGGFIGYEISRQLMDAGKTVAFFGIIDAHTGYINIPESGAKIIAKKIIRQFRKIPFIIKTLIEYPAEAFQYQKMMIKGKIPGLKVESNANAEVYTPHESEINNTYARVIQSYGIKPLDISISLFRAKKKLYFIDDSKYMGWKKYALKGMKLYDVPGDHKTFIEPPNSETFVEILQKAIDY